MELDPACAEVETPGRLFDGALVEIEADEREQLPRRRSRVRERPIVGGA